MISIDFETRSTTDLVKSGVYKYVEDPNTGIWCMAYQIDDEPVRVWVEGQPFPDDLRAALADGHELRAWNAQFERVVWNTVGVERYGFPKVEDERFVCTQADALAMGLPAKLEKAAAALRVPIQKDMKGNRLAIQMSKPRKTKDGSLAWWDDLARRQRLYDYCAQDVLTERAVMAVTRRLDPPEQRIYRLDQTINDRGVRLDVPLVKRMRDVALEGTRRANHTVAQHTNGDVSAITQVGRLQHWLREQGCDIPDLKATTLQKYLKQRDLPQHIREVLLARAEAGKASVAKLDKMLDVVTADGYLHGLLQYHGAATGRWAGRLVQPQNFPRGSVEGIEQFIPLVGSPLADYELIDYLHSPVDVVSSMLRSTLIASPGHTLMAADFSAIEARVLAWLAGQDDLVTMFAEFDAGIGEEVYVLTANEFNTTRQIGKAVILGAGYGMGAKKFMLMAHDVYGVNLDFETADKFVSGYRSRYSNIPKFWKRLEKSAVYAVANPGSVTEVSDGRIKFVYRGDHLWMILPAKRPLCYPDPRIVERVTPWGEIRPAVEISSMNSFTHQWGRRDLYGGLLAENAVQAASRDLLANSMFEVEAEGYPVVMTVHDEIIADVPEGHGSFEEYSTLMQRTPPWAEGCPVKVSGWQGKRYRKG